MRWLLAAVVVVGGACKYSRPPRLPDGRVERARPLVIETEREVRGTIVAPRGHRSDWYTAEETDRCESLTVELRWKAPRHGAKLELHVYGPRGGRWEDTGSRYAQVFVHPAAPGHYHLEVRGAGGADTAYRLRVRMATEDEECGGLPPPPERDAGRPPSGPMPEAPAGMLLLPITQWREVQYSDRETALMADLGAGYDDGADDEPATLVDASGAVLPDVKAEVWVDRDEPSLAHHAKLHIDGAEVPATAVAALVPRPAVPKPPLMVEIRDRWTDHDDAFVELDVGAFAGVETGWRVQLLDDSGAVAGEAEVVGVDPRRCRARLTGGTFAGILETGTARLLPPR